MMGKVGAQNLLGKIMFMGLHICNHTMAEWKAHMDIICKWGSILVSWANGICYVRPT